MMMASFGKRDLLSMWMYVICMLSVMTFEY